MGILVLRHGDFWLSTCPSVGNGVTLDFASLLIGTLATLVPLILAVAVSWGRFKQVVTDLAGVVSKLDDKVSGGLERLATLEADSDAHGERLDRLELPLFRSRP